MLLPYANGNQLFLNKNITFPFPPPGLISVRTSSTYRAGDDIIPIVTRSSQESSSPRVWDLR